MLQKLIEKYYSSLDGENSCRQECPCFSGEYLRPVSSRRIVLPAQWRRAAGVAPVFIIQGGDSLLLIPRGIFMGWFEACCAKITCPDDQNTWMHDMAHITSLVSCDKKGRIATPKWLLTLGGIGERAFLIGENTCIRIRNDKPGWREESSIRLTRSKR